MKDFQVKFCLADSEFNTALRLVAGAIASIADVDIDSIEDFKVCVTESALILKNCGFESVVVTFSTADGVSCQVQGLDGNPFEGETDLSLALIGALVSRCNIEKEQGVISKITLGL